MELNLKNSKYDAEFYSFCQKSIDGKIIFIWLSYIDLGEKFINTGNLLTEEGDQVKDTSKNFCSS